MQRGMHLDARMAACRLAVSSGTCLLEEEAEDERQCAAQRECCCPRREGPMYAHAQPIIRTLSAWSATLARGVWSPAEVQT